MHWNVDPVLVDLGFLQLRWYGLFFAIGIVLGVSALGRYFRQRGLPEEHANSLALWLPIGMILGAHLVHLVFYEPRSFIYNPRRIIEIGSGLASHGGGLGAILALWLFCRRHGQSFYRYADPSMLAAMWVIPWVRVGNFFNSEIYGTRTDLPWGVIFERHGFTQPRHPSQVYEAIIGFSLLGLALWLNRNYARRWRPGAFLYFNLFTYFITRFMVEYVKEHQVFDPTSPFDMGQYLSAPIVLVSAYMLLFSKRHNIVHPYEGAGDVAPAALNSGTATSASTPSSVRKRSVAKRR